MDTDTNADIVTNTDSNTDIDDSTREAALVLMSFTSGPPSKNLKIIRTIISMIPNLPTFHGYERIMIHSIRIISANISRDAKEKHLISLISEQLGTGISHAIIKERQKVGAFMAAVIIVYMIVKTVTNPIHHTLNYQELVVTVGMFMNRTRQKQLIFVGTMYLMKGTVPAPGSCMSESDRILYEFISPSVKKTPYRRYKNSTK